MALPKSLIKFMTFPSVSYTGTASNSIKKIVTYFRIPKAENLMFNFTKHFEWKTKFLLHMAFFMTSRNHGCFTLEFLGESEFPSREVKGLKEGLFSEFVWHVENTHTEKENFILKE